MADQQPGDIPAAGPDLDSAAQRTAAQPTAAQPTAAQPTAAQPTTDQPAAPAVDPTRVEGGEVAAPAGSATTADVPARWSGSAAVPPPVPKRSWWSRRRAQPEPDDRVAVPAVDPWADQDTPWDLALPPMEPMPPTRFDQPEPMPPTRHDRPERTDRAAPAPSPSPTGLPPASPTAPAPASPAAPSPAAPAPAGPPPRRRWGRKRPPQPTPSPANRLPVAPRPDEHRRPGPPAFPGTPAGRGAPTGFRGPQTGFRGAPPAPPVSRDHRGRPLPAPVSWRPPARRPLPPPPRRRRRWPRRLALLTVAGVACCCGVPAYFSWPAARQHPVTAALPDTVADLDLRSDRASRRAADRLADGLRATGASNVFAGVYGDRNGKRVTIAGTTGFRLTPEADVEAELDRLAAAYDVRDVAPFDAGETGVHERCGVGRANGGTVVVCAWADHGSLATVLTTRRSVADSAELTGLLRGAVLTRG